MGFKERCSVVAEVRQSMRQSQLSLGAPFGHIPAFSVPSGMGLPLIRAVAGPTGRTALEACHDRLLEPQHGA
jgi:hypothetical protein